MEAELIANVQSVEEPIHDFGHRRRKILLIILACTVVFTSLLAGIFSLASDVTDLRGRIFLFETQNKSFKENVGADQDLLNERIILLQKEIMQLQEHDKQRGHAVWL
jgi:hypothetical protein